MGRTACCKGFGRAFCRGIEIIIMTYRQKHAEYAVDIQCVSNNIQRMVKNSDHSSI